MADLPKSGPEPRWWEEPLGRALSSAFTPSALKDAWQCRSMAIRGESLVAWLHSEKPGSRIRILVTGSLSNRSANERLS